MESKTKILVIGSGVSGLAAIKACKEESLDVVCYEKTGEWGGLWRYHENVEEGSVMKNTISNTSKEMSAFSDFPPSSQTPTYLHHTNVIKYLESYAEHFNLLSCVRYFQEVLEMIPAENYDITGKWLVKVRDLHLNETREETFDGVMVCSGHHAHPSTPTYPNMDLYTGKVMHSVNYKSFSGMENETVLVVGAGNSGADIAAEVSNVANKVYLSCRRGCWIFPRMVDKGKPLDIFLHRRYRFMLPISYLAKSIEKTLNQKMDHERFGMKPSHSPLSQHPTVNDEIQAKILSGTISIKSDIKEFKQNGVIFDGEEEVTPVSVVVFATGFQIKIPFLADDILRVGKKNKILLFENMFPPQLKHHTLAVIGLIQPNGSLFPVFEIQSRWFVALMTGKCHLPSNEKMLSAVKSIEDLRAQNYVQSDRHSIEVVLITYMDGLAERFGAKPSLARLFFQDPKLYYACFFGPCLPYQYRLSGPHKWSGAREAILNYKSRLYEHLQNYRGK